MRTSNNGIFSLVIIITLSLCTCMPAQTQVLKTGLFKKEDLDALKGVKTVPPKDEDGKEKEE